MNERTNAIKSRLNNAQLPDWARDDIVYLLAYAEQLAAFTGPTLLLQRMTDASEDGGGLSQLMADIEAEDEYLASDNGKVKRALIEGMAATYEATLDTDIDENERKALEDEVGHG